MTSAQAPEMIDNGPDRKSYLLSRNGTHLIVDTEYVQMNLELRRIHWSYNALSSFASWVLLAGYLVIPGTFTSLQKSSSLEEDLKDSMAKSAILATVQNPPLIVISCIFLVTGALIMIFLFWKWKHNYIWLINQLFLPTLFNAGAGLLTSFVNVYTAKHGDWSIMALLTVIITGLSASISMGLTIFYQFWKLRIVLEEHERQKRAGLQLV